MQAISDLLTGIITVQIFFLVWTNATEGMKLADFHIDKPLLPEWGELIPPEWKEE